ncbi:MAG: O-antigen ligase family protein [Candidatus Latescibacterota bacterium]|nr:MAG: O-antigen ligase family protein [Candidatus Latescibacterota bacterium]
MHVFAQKSYRYLTAVSLCGLAVFIPFSIAGANVSIMLGFLASIIGIIAVPSVRQRYAEIKNDPMTLACLLLVVSAIPSVLMSETLPRALRDWKSYWLLLVYFLVAYNLTSSGLRRAVFWILFVATSVSCLVAVVQYRGGLDLLFIHISRQSLRPSSTLFTMTFAGILYQLITVNFTVLLRRRRISWIEPFFVGGLLLQIVGLVLTLTRGAWVALFGGLTSVVFLIRRKLVFIIAGALFISVVAIALQDVRVRKKVASIPWNDKQESDVNISTRFVLWDVSWDVIKSHPILGVGMGDFTTEAEKRLAGRHVETLIDSHNIYLQILATRGLVGFLPFLYFWFVLLRSLHRARRRLREHQGFGWHFVTGVLAAAVAVLIGALTENNIDDSEIFTAFMLLVGMAGSFARTPDRDTT